MYCDTGYGYTVYIWNISIHHVVLVRDGREVESKDNWLRVGWGGGIRRNSSMFRYIKDILRQEKGRRSGFMFSHKLPVGKCVAYIVNALP